MQFKKSITVILIAIAVNGLVAPNETASAAKKVARVVQITKQTKRDYHLKNTSGYVYQLKGKKIKKAVKLQKVAKLTKYQKTTLVVKTKIVIKPAKGKKVNYLLVAKGSQTVGYILQSKLQSGKYQVKTKEKTPTQKAPTKAPTEKANHATSPSVNDAGAKATTPTVTPVTSKDTAPANQNVSLQVNPFDNRDDELSGTATAGANITVTIKDCEYALVANAKGIWSVNLETIIGGADNIVIVASKDGLNTATLTSELRYADIKYVATPQTPLNGSHFPKRTIKYFIATTDEASQNAWQQGIDAWNSAEIVKFEVVASADDAELVLDNSLGEFTQMMNNPASGTVPEAVGITYRPGYSKTTGIYQGVVNVLIRSGYLADNNMLASAWSQITTHELGHALGLNHNLEHSLSVMDPNTYEDYRFDPNAPYAHETIQVADTDALHGIYDDLPW